LKGKGNRAWQKHSIPLPKDKNHIVIIAENLTEEQALNAEKELIAKYGRKDLGTGILHNRTNGGEGVSGYKVPDEIKYKYIKIGKANGMFGKKHSHKVKQDSSLRRSKTNSCRKWYNNGEQCLFAPELPGPEWKLGRINQKPTTTGYTWWNNGVVNYSAKEKPKGNEWARGMLPRNRLTK